MQKKSVGILTFRKYEGKPQVGSSTIRCDWLLNYWPEAEEFKYGQHYDVVIYHKCYWPEHAKLVKGVKILDLCDPDFMHWAYRTNEMIDEVDAVVCSTELLATDVSNFTDKPVRCITDRIDLELFKKRKKHKGKARKVAWFGYSQNFFMLDPVINHLKKNNLQLKVVSEKEYHVPAGHPNYECKSSLFDWDTIADELLWADFIVNPQGASGKWRYKSENKTILSWALGLPVVKSPEDMENLKLAENRELEAERGYKIVKEKYGSKISVAQYKSLINKIKETKNV